MGIYYEYIELSKNFMYNFDSDYLKNNGTQFEFVINDFFNDLSNCFELVAHNIIQDITTLNLNFERYNISPFDFYKNNFFTIYCTFKNCLNICKENNILK